LIQGKIQERGTCQGKLRNPQIPVHIPRRHQRQIHQSIRHKARIEKNRQRKCCRRGSTRHLKKSIDQSRLSQRPKIQLERGDRSKGWQWRFGIRSKLQSTFHRFRYIFARSPKPNFRLPDRQHQR